MSAMRVLAAPCDECLLTPNRIVDSKRMAGIVRECREHDRFFVCHRSTIAGYDGGAGNVCCRGFYDLDPEGCTILQVAGRLGLLVFIDERDLYATTTRGRHVDARPTEDGGD